MANRDLMNDLLSNRWNATHAPAAAATLVCNVAAPSAAASRRNLETLVYSIHNRTGAGAIPATVTVSVRHATPAGTVIASMDHLIGASSVVNVAMTNLMIQGKRGKGLYVTMDTVVASLTQKCNIAGWTED